MTMTAYTDTSVTQEIERKTVWISFRCSPIELAELRDHAHEARISVSKLTRLRVLGLPPPKAAVPQVNAQVHANLGRIGSNLNQITRLLDETGQLRLQQLTCTLAELQALLNRVRLEVIGVGQAVAEDDA